MTGKIQNFTVSGGYNQSMSNEFPEIFVIASGLPTGSSYALFFSILFYSVLFNSILFYSFQSFFILFFLILFYSIIDMSVGWFF